MITFETEKNKITVKKDGAIVAAIFIGDDMNTMEDLRIVSGNLASPGIDIRCIDGLVAIRLTFCESKK